MRVFVTGATGFIGGRLARRLRDRGDDVVALVRSPERATSLREAGCELVEGDLASADAIRRGVTGAGAVVHAGAVYQVGIPASEHAAMEDANVRGTERVLDAAIAAGVPRIVHVSTINAFGNTRGQTVDESYRRPGDDFVSFYDETKWRAHQVALDRIARGAPVVIVQPGAVYGPGDHSELGTIIEQAMTGRLRFVSFASMGVNLVFVDDVAEGILLALDRGTVGEAYVLGGEIVTMSELVRRAAEVAGRRPPRIAMPNALVRASIPLAPVLTRAMGMPPNLRELISASDGVTYWATDAKARSELGYAPRTLEQGLRETAGALTAVR